MANEENNESFPVPGSVLKARGEQALESAQNLALNKGVSQDLAEQLSTAIAANIESVSTLGNRKDNIDMLTAYTHGQPTEAAERLMERFIERTEGESSQTGQENG